MAGVRIVDGSGLSRLDRLTANALGGLLKVAWADPVVRPALLSALPVAGVNGTLQHRLLKPPARGRDSTARTPRPSSAGGLRTAEVGGRSNPSRRCRRAAPSRAARARRHRACCAARYAAARRGALLRSGPMGCSRAWQPMSCSRSWLTWRCAGGAGQDQSVPACRRTPRRRISSFAESRRLHGFRRRAGGRKCR